ASRKLFLPVWFFATLYLMTRGPDDRNTIIVSLLATVAVFEVVVPLATTLTCGVVHQKLEMRTALTVILIVLGLYGLFSAFSAEQITIRDTLAPTDRQAMAWVAANTPTNAEFLIFDKMQAAGSDSVVEWFPALSSRRSPTVPFGQEWVGFKMMSV